MAKAGKLGKLLKKMSFVKTNSSRTPSTTATMRRTASCSATVPDSKSQLFPVYVGKSRRRYLVTTEVVDHPLFRELVERSPPAGDDEIAVACEVVLFEHLLWMLDNADPRAHPESLDELVDFYAC